MSFGYQLQAKRGKARAGLITTPHGVIQTPMFMPVGTLGTVKSLDTQDIVGTGAQIILGNTYHLYLRPGLEVLRSHGGLHPMMGWEKPILTDSGGFQAFSLQHQRESSGQKNNKKLAKLSEEGVKFYSHLDGSQHLLTPEKSMEIQQVIGSDIIMALDECMSDDYDLATAKESVLRTSRWAKRSFEAWEKANRQSEWGKYQALFGIIQGGLHQELRIKSAQDILELDFDGIALGGETIGYDMAGTGQVMEMVEDLLPADKPRYAMGLGRDPQNLVDATLMGFDMFDCVGPTRLARNGTLYEGHLFINQEGVPEFTSEYNNGRLQIGNSQFMHDKKPISQNCQCYTCQQNYSRSYLNHLFKAQELTYYRLASIHNVAFFIQLSQKLRQFVMTGQLGT